MLEIRWLVAGVIAGLLISTVIIPPTRKVKTLPSPHDDGTYHTDSGCVKFISVEVPCTSEPESLNLLATK